MTDRRNLIDVLWMSLQWAKQDRTSFLYANSNMSDAIKKDIEADIRAIERLQKKLFPNSRTKLDGMLENTRLVTLDQLKNIIKTKESKDTTR